MTSSEFSYPVSTDNIGPKEKKIYIQADLSHKKYLTGLMDVDSIETFDSIVILKRIGQNRIEAKFTGTCHLTQTCVVSFKPVSSEIELSFQRIYDPNLKSQITDGEVEIDFGDPDLLESIENNTIDLCHPLTEELSLAIDPFPKAENTTFEPVGFGPEITEEEVQESSPFAVLSTLKKKK